jgi:hypothetical protein
MEEMQKGATRRERELMQRNSLGVRVNIEIADEFGLKHLAHRQVNISSMHAKQIKKRVH